MPPKVKFQKEEIVAAAVDVTREKGAQAVTAREVAAQLGVSTRPIFTYFDTMDQLKGEVYEYARALYRSYVERGLSEPIPFLGIWRYYLLFAREEPQLYKLMFLTPPSPESRGAIEALRYSQDLARESLMHCYNMDAFSADCYFRDLWIVAYGFATLVVTDDCPYTDEEMLAVGAEISLSICKAYKEIPGLPHGDYDRDALFGELVTKEPVMQTKALVVIDIQNDITKHYKDIIDNINAAIDWADAKGMHVIYIKHNNITSGTRTFKPGSKGEELAPELKVVSSNIFTKTKSNALTSEAFSAFISENGIDEFFVVGADATACVKSTCYNMTKAGFSVHVISDCVTSYDLKKVDEMLAYYQKKGCEVATLAEIIEAGK